jgi:hypothetical protein
MGVRDVELGDGITIPAEISRAWDDIDGYTVELTATYDADSGRYTTSRLEVEAKPGREVTGEGLRMIAVAGLLRHAVAEKVAPLLQPSVTHPRDLGQAGPTTETLRHVAALYRLAVVLGDAPTQRVADTLGVPRSTASRWVTRSRDRGYLTVVDPRAGRKA